MSGTPQDRTRQRTFERFLLGDALALLAMTVGGVAVPWWITVQNGARDMAIYAIVAAAVAFAVMPITSTIGDRYDKRILIQIGLGLCAVTSLVMASLATFGSYNIHIILAVDAVAVSGLALVSPIGNVIAPDILPADRVSQGLQRQRLFQSAGQLVGPLVGGGALAYAGVKFALWVQVLLLLLAIAFIGRLPGLDVKGAHDSQRSWLHELTAGMRAKWCIALERNWTAIGFLGGLFLTPSLGMLLPLKVHAMALEGEWLGISEAGLALGLLLGAAVGMSRSLVARIGRYQLRFAASILMGPAVMLVGFSSNPIVLVAALMLVGIANAMVVMMGYSRRILATPARFRTRMMAVNMMLPQLASMVGPLAAAIILLRLPIGSVYVIFGASLLICNFGYLLVPDFRVFMSLADDEVEGWYGQRYPEAFEPRLPRTTS